MMHREIILIVSFYAESFISYISLLIAASYVIDLRDPAEFITSPFASTSC